ncbi:TRAP transporter small permease [Oricola sp.]|uniref:TRAP transporter small permease n=1 Tax=Oricola sp. TaxID=1979950 RepID=UPI0025E83C22|nr:TRAP transporter small permease [Oricola sp.]MCI5076021.1 TRAP transporter small permease [Oricola sp.]
MLDRIDRVLEWWSRALLALAILAGLAMMIHVTVDVFARTVFHSPLKQTNQMVAAYYMIAAAFLPIAFLGKHDDHITADVFTDYMGPRLRHVLLIFTNILGMAYMYVFTWQSWISAGRRTAQGEVLEISGGYMMVWPGRWLLPIAGASLFLCLALRVARLLLHKGVDEEHHSRIPDA